MKKNTSNASVVSKLAHSIFATIITVQFGMPSFSIGQVLAPPTTETSSKSVQFYSCLHSKKDNYFWTMYLSKSTPQTVTGDMTVEQILEHSGPETIVSQLVVDSARKSLSRFVQKSIERSSNEDFNLAVEFSNSLRLFGRYLRMRLKNTKNLSFKSPIEFELMFAPRASDQLLDKQKQGIVLRNSVYPLDRVLVAEQILDNDSFKNFDVEKSDMALNGIQSLMRDALGCGESAGIHQAYPASIILKMVINPDIDSSKISAQFVAGMPTGQNLPFAQSNEQISFQSIKLPDTVKDTPEDKGNLPLLMAFHFPVAMIDISTTLDSTEIPISIRLGTLGNLTNSGWQLSPFGKDSMKRLPKLVGVPGDQAKSSLAENAKKRLLVEFNISSLVLMMDYKKYAEQRAVEIQELDLLISAGLNRFPGFTFGKFSVASVDEQFKSEINKTIVAQIAAQEESMKKKINDAKLEVSKQTGLNEKQIDGILKALFSKNSQASAAQERP